MSFYVKHGILLSLTKTVETIYWEGSQGALLTDPIVLKGLPGANGASHKNSTDVAIYEMLHA